jgi:DNA-binding response OmpR family regulator
MKILYVEDETEAREALAKYLKRRFGKLFTGVDGLDGLRVFMEQSPDVIIVDLYMPGMGGLEMIREIRKISTEAYVIVTSAVDDVDTILKSVDIGIDKYLLKPINPEELTQAIQEYQERTAKKLHAEENFEGERKRQLEDLIKREFTSFLKNTTGKGPGGVSVFINYKEIEIKAYDVLTVMEKNMTGNHENRILVEQYRKLFYSIKEEAICCLIQNIIGCRVQLKHVEASVEKGTNEITLQIL